MKNYFILILAFVLGSCSFNKTSKQDALVHFENKEHDFALLKYKRNIDHIFLFTNPGETPLIIQDVKTSCGCTVPDWPKKPIKPGRAGEIKVTYNADFPGMFSKTITVFYNGKDSPLTLTIKGKVEYPEEIETAQR